MQDAPPSMPCLGECDPASGGYTHADDCPTARDPQCTTVLPDAPLEDRLLAAEAQQQDARACSCKASGIRGLLEHVGIDTTGRDIYVGGRIVDAADEAQQAEVFGPDVVAYRHPSKPRTYLCRAHGDGRPGLTPLDSDDLPDGGLCDDCGADVLAQQAGESR